MPTEQAREIVRTERVDDPIRQMTEIAQRAEHSARLALEAAEIARRLNRWSLGALVTALLVALASAIGVLEVWLRAR